MNSDKSIFNSIEAVVTSGRAIVAGDDSTVITMVQEAINNGRTATFYVSKSQYRSVMRWYWTPRRIAETGIELVSDAEKARIEADLMVKDSGPLFSNRLKCPCGAIYGAFEFIQQGIQEHGKEMVERVLEFENAAVIRVNPPTSAICTNCKQPLGGAHYYEWWNGYGCSRPI